MALWKRCKALWNEFASQLMIVEAHYFKCFSIPGPSLAGLA